MGLLNVWYVNFFKAASHGLRPYAQYLHRFAAYRQQLTMESNGKGVRSDGLPGDQATPVRCSGASPELNGQHAFYQLDLPGHSADPRRLHRDGEHRPPASRTATTDVHELFLANFFAQTKALAFGKTAEEVRAEGTKEGDRQRPGCSAATGRRPRSWHPPSRRRWSAKSSPSTSTSPSSRAWCGASTRSTSGASSWASSSRNRSRAGHLGRRRRPGAAGRVHPVALIRYYRSQRYPDGSHRGALACSRLR